MGFLDLFKKRKYKVGDRIRIAKDGTATGKPEQTGHHEKVWLEEKGHQGTIISFYDREVPVVKWDPATWKVFDDFVPGPSGLEVMTKGTVDLASFETRIHNDYIEKMG